MCLKSLGSSSLFSDEVKAFYLEDFGWLSRAWLVLTVLDRVDPLLETVVAPHGTMAHWTCH